MSHLTSVRIVDDLYTQALVEAEINGCSVSAIINQALNEHFNK
jgi:predicted HicB family RNase H-like nuclease